ncbi:hypothetical protein GQ55_1G295600 [Panicum hallii var. hallii]|uniref:Uncharacterized protein n=1 Tax=Panicum hallii var. hallii TaxID=1504633 RepID=A0A2T7F8U2_9POAL|nr:hypothetical protein GQ55_1G295600 [Panicum hallii var. hallii]
MFAWNTVGQRLCARRILCFLRAHCLQGAAHQLEKDTAVFFNVSHLGHLARSARWDELTSYVGRFMPFHSGPPSPQASRFLRCLHVYTVLGRIAAGGKHAEGVRTMFPLLDAAAAAANPRTAALHAFFHRVLQSPPRDFADLMRIWAVAAERLKDLALECPELKGKLHLPNTAPKSWQINLSGVPRPVLRPYTKKVNKQKARDLACLIEEKRQEILGNLSAVSSDETFDSMRYGMQVAPAPPLVQTAPGVDATAAAGTLGRGYGSREEAGEDASKWEKKRKMSSTATPEMTQDASSTPSTRSMKVARKD